MPFIYTLSIQDSSRGQSQMATDQMKWKQFLLMKAKFYFSKIFQSSSHTPGSSFHAKAKKIVKYLDICDKLTSFIASSDTAGAPGNVTRITLMLSLLFCSERNND